jgi:DNA helicase-2/ATP-dependent DNA helicase PcrA
MLDLSHLTDSLNPQQREAVTAPAGNLLVLAGAGSGKTKVLTHRFAWLMEVEKISPQAILAVTFTNKAANEMRERLNKLLHLNPRSWWVGTFHGLAHRWLRQHWQEANLPQAFQILDSDDQLRIIKKILKFLKEEKKIVLDDKVYQPNLVQGYINRSKDRGIRPLYIEAFDQYSQTMKLLYEYYQEHCEQNGLVDFGELLLRVYEMWYHNPDLLKDYRQRFPHILVDEFQDTNIIQYTWLQQLIGKTGCAFVVGDDDQSIYGWRGAEIGNVQKFQKDFEDVHLVRLEQNYRSTQIILGAANALIEKNEARMGKTLWTQRDEGERIELFESFNEESEALTIVEKIQQRVSQNFSYKDCAILYRSNAQSRILEKALVQKGLPYRIYGNLKFFQRQEIKDALAYLRLLVNPNDDGSFERAISVPSRKIGDITMEKLREYAQKNQISLWQSVEILSQEKQSVQSFKYQLNQSLSLLDQFESPAHISSELNSRSVHLLRQFLDMILHIKKMTEQMPLYQLVNTVLLQSGLLKFYQEKKGEKEQMRAENLQELVNAAKEFETDNIDELSPLMAFLTSAALESGENQSAPNQDAVQLMTLHAAKGLEFPVVFLCGLEEGLVPPIDSNVEEERRLLYVGITRAMKYLYFSFASTRTQWGLSHTTTLSRFVREEIPEKFLNKKLRLKTKAEDDPLSAFAPPPTKWESVEKAAKNFIKKQNYAPPPKWNEDLTESASVVRKITTHIADKDKYFSPKPEKYYTSNDRFEPNKTQQNQQPVNKQAWVDPQASFKVNQKVQHEKFGIGIVLANEGKGEQERVYVDFGKHGKKWLVLSYAKLQPT